MLPARMWRTTGHRNDHPAGIRQRTVRARFERTTLAQRSEPPTERVSLSLVLVLVLVLLVVKGTEEEDDDEDEMTVQLGVQGPKDVLAF